MKKFFIGLAVFFLAAGIAATVTDKKDSEREVAEIRSYPVVAASKLAPYIEKNETQEIIVTEIPLEGELVTDPKGLLEGEYYYLTVRAEQYRPDEDDLFSELDREANWANDDKLSYEVSGKELVTSLNHEVQINKDNVFGLPELMKYYLEDTKEPQEGDIRYVYCGLGKDDTLTALFTVGDGETKLHKMISYKEGNYYVYGDEKAAYRYIDMFRVGDSFVFVALGVILAAVFGVLAYKVPFKGRGHRKLKQPLEKHKEGYQELTGSMRVRYWVLKFIGAAISAGGLAIIVCNTDSDVMIVLGTLVLIAGCATWLMSSPEAYNSVSDEIQMIACNPPKTIETVYEAYKMLNTPLGSPYLATFKTAKQKMLVFGPDQNHQYLYFWLNKSGTAGYLGFSFLTWAIKKRLTEPLIPMQNYENNLADYICFNSDVILLKKQLGENLKHYMKTGEVLPLPHVQSSEVYTFTEDFKLTGQHFTLCDMKQNPVYEIDGTMPLKSFHIYDQSHNEVFKVTKELLNLLPTYRFYLKGELYGRLEKKFSFVKDRFTMETTEGILKLEELAGYIGHNYGVYMNEKPIGFIMDDLSINVKNLVFDNSVVIAYEPDYLPVLTAMAIMAAREIARDEEASRE